MKDLLLGSLIRKSQERNKQTTDAAKVVNALGLNARAKILQSNNLLNGFNAETGRALTTNGARQNATEPQGIALSVPKPVHLEPDAGFSVWN